MAIKAEKPGEGVLRPNGAFDIKAKKQGVIRPNGALDIKAKKTGQGALRPTPKSWELFHQFLSVYRKKFPTNLT